LLATGRKCGELLLGQAVLGRQFSIFMRLVH
jgi:hypothetical protein